MQISDSSLKVLSLCCCLKSPRPGMSIVFSVLLYRLTMLGQPNNISTRVTFQHVLHWFQWPTSRTPFHAHFDINLASSQFTLVMLSVDFCCLSNSAFTYSKYGYINVTGGKVQYIEDIYFFEVNTKYISSSVLKILMFSTHKMKYIWYLQKEKKFSFYFILFRRFTVNRVTVFRTKIQRIVCDRIP